MSIFPTIHAWQQTCIRVEGSNQNRVAGPRRVGEESYGLLYVRVGAFRSKNL